MSDESFDLIVVGAGLAGLVAGATAAATGARTVVLEAHRPGGRARVAGRDGYIWNMGGHALYMGGPGMDALRSLGVSVEGSPPPLERYQALWRGKLHLLPTTKNGLASTSLLDSHGKAALREVLVQLHRIRPEGLEGTTVDEGIASFELKTEVEQVIRALLRLSTYANDFSTFGADAAVGQLQLAAAGVCYLDGAWAQLYERLAAKVEVRTGVKVIGLEPAAGRVEVVGKRRG